MELFEITKEIAFGPEQFSKWPKQVEIVKFALKIDQKNAPNGTELPTNLSKLNWKCQDGHFLPTEIKPN